MYKYALILIAVALTYGLNQESEANTLGCSASYASCSEASTVHYVSRGKIRRETRKDRRLHRRAARKSYGCSAPQASCSAPKASCATPVAAPACECASGGECICEDCKCLPRVAPVRKAIRRSRCRNGQCAR